MPFDPTGFEYEPPQATPEQRKAASRSEAVLLSLIVVLALLLLVMPLTPQALMDLSAYVGGM